MATDIKPLGAGDGKSFYWIKVGANIPGAVGHLQLVVVDEYGQIMPTTIRGRWDHAAATRSEAVESHLSGGIAEADRDLERRRREAPEPEPSPPPMDPPTARFFDDGRNDAS